MGGGYRDQRIPLRQMALHTVVALLIPLSRLHCCKPSLLYLHFPVVEVNHLQLQGRSGNFTLHSREASAHLIVLQHTSTATAIWKMFSVQTIEPPKVGHQQMEKFNGSQWFMNRLI